MKGRLTIAAVSAVAALVLVSAAAPRAEAMAMYNNSTYYQGGTEVRFVCGIFCGWFSKGIGYKEQQAYPGKGGSFSIIQDGCTMSSGHPNIEDHGYAVLTGADLNSDSEGIQWSMWGNGGNVISGSPFDVVCFPSQRPQPSQRSLGSLAGGQVNRQFRAWDSDRNGALSGRELRAGARRDFRQIDLNHDGVVNAHDVRIDLKRQRGEARQRAAKTGLAFDLNRSGDARPGEYWRYVRRTFVGAMEGNRNGLISRREVKAYYEELAAASSSSISSILRS